MPAPRPPEAEGTWPTFSSQFCRGAPETALLTHAGSACFLSCCYNNNQLKCLPRGKYRQSQMVTWVPPFPSPGKVDGICLVTIPPIAEGGWLTGIRAGPKEQLVCLEFQGVQSLVEETTGIAPNQNLNTHKCLASFMLPYMELRKWDPQHSSMSRQLLSSEKAPGGQENSPAESILLQFPSFRVRLAALGSQTRLETNPRVQQVEPFKSLL